MFRKTLPQNLILTLICASVLVGAVFSQTLPPAEVTLSKCWSYPVADGVSRMAADGSGVFTAADGGKVEAISLDGQQLWRAEFGWNLTSNILVLDDNLYFATAAPFGGDKGKSGGNTLRLLSRKTGIPTGQAKLPDAATHFLGVYKDALIVVSSSGAIESFDARSLEVKWKREIAEGFVAEPRFLTDKIIVASNAKQVFVVSLASGEIESLRKVPNNVTAVAQTSAGDLIVGDDRGNVTSLLGSTEKVNWKFRSGGEISSIFNVDDHILVTSHDNFAYSIATRNGGLAWKRRFSGRIARISTFQDKYAVISGFDDHGAILTNLETGKVAGQIALVDDESVISSRVIASGLIVMLTNASVRAYGLDGCSDNKDGGPGKIARGRRQKN